MNKRTHVSEENLLSLSRNKIFETALQEWQYTGKVIDHEEAVMQCQLCEQEQLRYHFQIANRLTESAMWVGSSCIEKFRIAVTDTTGNRLNAQDAQKQLRKDLAEHQLEMMKEPLRELYKQAYKPVKDQIVGCVRQIEKDQGLTPQEVLFLFQQMTDHSIPFPATLYPVRLRAKLEKNELAQMSEDEVQLIWPALTTSQQTRYAKICETFEAEKLQREAMLQKRANEEAQARQRRSVSNLSPERDRYSRQSSTRSIRVEPKPTPAYGPMEMTLAICTECGAQTRDWVIYNGADGTCTCRACSRKA